MKNTVLVAANSSILYVRLVIITLLKLWATKMMVHYLGLEDFGIYNLLAGIVVMLAFLKATMASASQRFISVSLGKNDINNTQELFYLLFVLHFLFAFVIAVVIDVAGCVLVQNVLNIPETRTDVAIGVIHLMALSTAVTIICVPHDALLISKENILALSVFMVLQYIFNLGAIFLLAFFDNDNRLIVYSTETVLLMLLLLSLRLSYNKRYTETHIKYHYINDWSLVKEISKYMGWNMVSSLFVMARNQGFSIVFNIVGGVIVNSAYGIANQVNALISYATEALMQPIRPQLTKTESSGNRKKSSEMAFFATKMILCLLSVIIIPLITNMDFILRVWLEDVPDYAVHFCDILLLSTFAYSFSLCLKSLIEAIGNVKKLFVVIGYMHLASLIVAILVLWLGGDVVLAYSIIIIEEILATFYRLYLAKNIAGINYWNYVVKIIIPCFCVFALFLILIEIIACLFSGILLLVISSLIVLVGISLIYYFAILNQSEKEKMLSLVDTLKMFVFVNK